MRHTLIISATLLLCLQSAKTTSSAQSSLPTITCAGNAVVAISESRDVVVWGETKPWLERFFRNHENLSAIKSRGPRAVFLYADSWGIREPFGGILNDNGTVSEIKESNPYGWEKKCYFRSIQAQQITVSGSHLIALDSSGNLHTCGDNDKGELNIPSNLNIKKVCAGYGWTVVLDEEGAIHTFGGDREDKYGNYDPTFDAPIGNDFADISVHSMNALALRRDGSVVNFGGIFNPGLGYTSVPSPIGLKAKAISAGEKHNLAVTEDGEVLGWGCSLISGGCDVPYGLNHAIGVVAGDDFSLAIRSDGTVFGWGSNEKGSLNIPKNFKLLLPESLMDAKELLKGEAPPQLQITSGSIAFSGSGDIAANEEYFIEFEISNVAGGKSLGLEAKVAMEGAYSGITIPSMIEIPTLKPGDTQTVTIPIQTDKSTESGLVKFQIEVVEPRGFSPAPFALEIPVREFRQPELSVVDFNSTKETWEANKPIGLDVLIQNLGSGDAGDVTAELSMPEGVVCFSSNELAEIGTLKKGEVHKLSYDFMIPRTYAGSDVSIGIQLSESYNQYGSDWSKSFPFKSTKKETVVIVQQGQQDQDTESEVVRATLGKTTNERGEVIFSQTNSSREVQAIAVIPKDGENCSGRTVSGDDLAVLGETAMLGLYTVVDRKFFEQTLEEIKLSMTGLTFENGVLEAGCIENAQGYLFVEYGCLQNQETIKAKLIHCESSEIIWNGLGQGTTASETFDEIVTRLDQE